MEHDFLSAVMPTQGRYCVFTLQGKQYPTNHFVDTLEEMAQKIAALSDRGLNTFHALASYDGDEKREAEHVQYLRSIFIDMDCGTNEKGKPKSFLSKRDAITKLSEFLEATHLSVLGMPWLVDSGGGVHCYWPLDRDVTIDEWLPVVKALKVRAAKENFKIDMTVTSDAARVLRSAGTLNWKYDPPKDVLLKQRGATFNLNQFRDIIGVVEAPVKAAPAALMLPGHKPKAAKTEMSAAAKALSGDSATYFKNIIKVTAAGKGCAQIANYINNAEEDGLEPIWRGMLSLTKYCVDADKASLKISAMHPYPEDRMRQKLADIKGPYSCEALEGCNPGGCDGCMHRGRITNPLILGREITTSVEPMRLKFVAEDDSEEIADLPTPPKGFSYGAKGAVYYTKPTKGDDEPEQMIMLTAYPFYMTRMFRDGPTYMAEFVYVKGETKTIFAIPSSSMSNIAEITKALASNNVMSVMGFGTDAYLAAYVRACASSSSALGKEVPVPPHLGWQEDGSFAVGDTIYSPRGPAHNYTYKSLRLHNVIEATRPAGTLESWQAVMHMMRDKAVAEPVYWGHVAYALAGLASPLMHNGPKGARACTLHACGSNSGAGKTFAMYLSNSVWGEPDAYTIRPTTSDTTLMQRAGLLGSIPLAVDEVTSKTRSSQGEWLPTHIYAYASGAHKLKGAATGNAEIQHDCVWDGICTISSNTPGLEVMMGAREQTSLGEVKRFLEWILPENWQMSWTESERKIKKLMENNYGVVGREWAQWLVTHRAEEKKVYAEMEAWWIHYSGATDDERFWTTTVVSTLAALVLAGPGYANLVNIPGSAVAAFYLGIVENMRSVIHNNRRDAKSLLYGYVGDYANNFVRVEGSALMSHLNLEPNSFARGAIRGRTESNVTLGMRDYYIEIKQLKIHCARHNFSYASFEAELLKKSAVSLCRKNLLAGTAGPEMRVDCLKVSMSIAEIEARDRR